MVCFSMSVFVTGGFSAARISETTIDSLSTGGLSLVWSSSRVKRKRRRALMSRLSLRRSEPDQVPGFDLRPSRPPLGCGDSLPRMRRTQAGASQALFVVNHAVDDLEAERRVRALGDVVVQPRIRGHLDAALRARPLLGGAKKRGAVPFAAVRLRDVPPLE